MPLSDPSSAAWNADLLRDPHGVPDKRMRIQRMFAAIAPSYDLNNRLHSLWLDQYWRRKTVRLAQLRSTDVVVDVACGTGDLTLAMQRAKMILARPAVISSPTIGVDFTFEMLPLACHKSASVFPHPVYLHGDALCLPLPDVSCDVISIAFGIRNVADPSQAIREFHRVLRPGGRVVILEFSVPANAILRGLYNFYFRRILPRTATFISRDKTGAYAYLPQSVSTFITSSEMISRMKEAGFSDVQPFPLTFGICTCYRGFKR